MWENIYIAIPVIAGALVLFILFCISLIIYEKNTQGKKGSRSNRGASVRQRSSFSYTKNAPLRKVTSPARVYPRDSYNFSAKGFCENASRRTAV
jgi:hypothetical protein